MSRIYIGADHRGFQLKEKITQWLEQSGYEYLDLGNHVYDREDDYTDFAIKVGEKVSAQKAMGILICGSGVGVCIAANKVKGIRAALCTTRKQARLARSDDDANILCLSSELVSEIKNKAIVRTFLETVFASEERYIKRLNKIKNYENYNIS